MSNNTPDAGAGAPTPLVPSNRGAAGAPPPSTAPEAGDDMAMHLQAAATTLLQAQHPLLFCHRSPDGDTAGAAIALAMILRELKRVPTIVCPEPLPLSVAFIPQSETILTALPDLEPPHDPDLLVTLDISDPGMLGEMRPDLERLRRNRTLLNIDHHASDTKYGDINVVDTTAASTAEIIYDLAGLLGVPVDTAMATALLTGIVNDTHSFQNANSSPRALSTAAALVAAGADLSMIAYNLLLRRRPQAALLWAQTLATLCIEDEGRVASAYATNDMVEACHAELADLDGVVEFLRNIDGVDLAFLLKGVADGSFKVSARTTGRVDAVELTAPFGGGGHRRAAGCDLAGPPDAARAALLARYYELTGRGRQ